MKKLLIGLVIGIAIVVIYNLSQINPSKNWVDTDNGGYWRTNPNSTTVDNIGENEGDIGKGIFLVAVVILFSYVYVIPKLRGETKPTHNKKEDLSGAFVSSDEWYKSQYKWEMVSSYFKKMIDEKIAPLNEVEKKFFYANQIMKIQDFISLQKLSSTTDKFQKWIVEEGDEILNKIDESQIEGENAKKACLYSAIMGQIAFASENNHLLHAQQKIHPPIEKFFYYAYEETLKRLNFSPYNHINFSC